ncbi:hypothetical protein M9435_004864 [Picochlorum sp. BPE23]|nr:hypothetical protein M9435_004864 [Picochlorum sp. BPE23]
MYLLTESSLNRYITYRRNRRHGSPTFHTFAPSCFQITIFSEFFYYNPIYLRMMMLTVSKTTPVAVCGSKRTTRVVPVSGQRRSMVARCEASTNDAVVDRRAALMMGGLSLWAVGSPAQAFLGIGEDRSAEYTEETQQVIDGIRSALEKEPNTDEREKAMGELKDISVKWVSKYRRDPKFAGRPSYSQMYSAVNALDGQLVSFGLKANFPKKRLDRMMKSVDDAERQLKRGR